MPRNFDRSTKVHTEEWVQDYNGVTGQPIGGPFVALEYDDVNTSESRSFFGYGDKNWKSFQKSNGYLPTRPATDLIVRAQCNPAFQQIYNGFGAPRRWRTSNALLPVPNPPLAPADLVDEANSKLRQRVMSQDFNASVFAAEAGKTVTMIADTATRIAKAGRALRQGHLGDFFTFLGVDSRGRKKGYIAPPKSEIAFHNLWLEHRYGWMPLLSDVDNAAKALAKANYPTNRSRFSVKVSRSQKELDFNPGLTFSGSINYTVKAWCIVRVTNSTVAAANQLGLLNPLLVAWELVPFSFVADWFLNVGDCIAELTAFAGLDVLDGGNSLATAISGTIQEINYSPWDAPRSTSFQARRFNRSPGVPSAPVLRMKSNPISVAKIITSAALITQVTKGHWK